VYGVERTQAGVAALSLSNRPTVHGRRVSLCYVYGVEHINIISSAGLHGLDQRQRRSETSEEVDVHQGQNALDSLSLSTGLTLGARLWLVTLINYI